MGLIYFKHNLFDENVHNILIHTVLLPPFLLHKAGVLAEVFVSLVFFLIFSFTRELAVSG